MARADEPIDFTISLEPSGSEMAILMEEQLAGEASSRCEVMKLQTVATCYDLLLREGGGVYEFAQLGQQLFGSLFSGAHQRALFLRACDMAEREERPLRILIKLPQESPLTAVPWEIMHDGDRFLAKDPRCAIVRYFLSHRPVPPFQVAPPLRVLITSASPKSQPHLDLEREITAVRAAYHPAGRSVDLQVVREVSLQRLEELWRKAEVEQQPFHIWHHCGHGHLVASGGDQQFFLSLVRDGEAEYASREQLSEIIGACPGLRLAVLNVCHGGSFAGLAPELAQLNVPVVIGFPSRVANDTAYKFAAILHQNLLHVPVELAVSQARRALCVQRSADLDWSQPILFSRRNDSGPILHAPPPEPILQSAEAQKRRPGGIHFKIGSSRSDEMISAIWAGDDPPPAKLPNVEATFEYGTVEAKSVKNFGFLVVNGFSSEHLKRRDKQMAELLRAIDEGRATEACHE